MFLYPFTAIVFAIALHKVTVNDTVAFVTGCFESFTWPFAMNMMNS